MTRKICTAARSSSSSRSARALLFFDQAFALGELAQVVLDGLVALAQAGRLALERLFVGRVPVVEHGDDVVPLHLPIDAVPDLTNVQVQVITEAPALSPLEVERLLSFPVEGAMSGLPNVEQIRSVSKFGVSVVTIVFHEGTDLYRARQLVGERLQRASQAIPPNSPACARRTASMV